MNTTYLESGASETAAYGGLADAVGGIATVVLAILALAGLEPEVLLGVATVVFGAALLIQAGTLLNEYAAVAFPSGAAATAAGVDSFAGDGLAFLFVVGAAGVVLGILALIGIAPVILTAAALIAFGSGLLLSSTSVSHLHQLKSVAQAIAAQSGLTVQTGREFLVGQMASGSAAAQILAGLAAIVLGILVLTHAYTGVLTLIGLLIIGFSSIMTGGALSGVVMSFVRPREPAR